MAGKRRLFWALGFLWLSAVLWLVGKEWTVRQSARAADLEASAGKERPDAESGKTRQNSEELTVYFEIQYAEEEPRRTFPPGDYHSNGWPPRSFLPANRP